MARGVLTGLADIAGNKAAGVIIGGFLDDDAQWQRALTLRALCSVSFAIPIHCAFV